VWQGVAAHLELSALNVMTGKTVSLHDTA